MRDPLDRYYTPDELAAELLRYIPITPGADLRVLEPSVGGGAWVRAIERDDAWDSAEVHVCDIDPQAPGLIHPRAVEAYGCGFLALCQDSRYDVILGNPPYRDAEAHVRWALDLAPQGVVAFLLRLSFLASMRRAKLWREHRLSRLVVLSSRPSFTGKGTDSSDYALFVWDRRPEVVYCGDTIMWHPGGVL